MADTIPNSTFISFSLSKEDNPLSQNSAKMKSTKFINRKRWIVGRFEWQTGFAAFSYAHSQLAAVARYIKNQEKHHSRQTFREEYLAFLERFNVPYNPKYVFDSDGATEV